MIVNCEQFEPVYAAYLDGNVSAEEQSLINEHLRQCPHCLIVVAWTRHVLRYWQDLSVIPPGGFGERLRIRLRGEGRDGERPSDV